MVTRSRRRSVARGTKRTPGVIGIDWEPLFGHHSPQEYSDRRLDLDTGFWIEAKDRDGDPTSVFYQGERIAVKQQNAKLKIDFGIQEAELIGSRGKTGSKLYLKFGIVSMTKGRFAPVLLSADMRSDISVQQKHKFDSLADFRPHYQEFRQLMADHGSRSAAFKIFATKHVKPSDGEYSTDFTGKRVKTVEHEVHHLRHAQESGIALVENMMGELQNKGRRKRTGDGWPGARRLIEQMAADWDSDPHGEFHRRIGEHDCLVMIAVYEAFALTIEEAKTAGNKDPLGGLINMLDDITLDMMEGIGEPIHTWGQ